MSRSLPPIEREIPVTVQNLRPQGGQLKGGKGLRGSDKQQEGLRDERHGAHESAATPIETLPMQQLSTPHEATQTGADIRAETTPSDDSMPEGLRRERKGPYSPTQGRKGEKEDQ